MNPRWLHDATAPTPAEVRRFLAEPDPAVLAAAREATRPTPTEVARLRPRTLPARRPVSPAWLGVPVAAVLTLLLARWVVPTTLSPAVEPEGASLYVVQPGDTVLVVRGVRLEGEGTARLVDGAVALEGDLRVRVEEPVELRIAGHAFRAEDALLEVDAGRSLLVLEGSATGEDGPLGPGDRWPAPVTVGRAIPPEPEPVATVALRTPDAPRRPIARPEVAEPAPVQPEPEPEPEAAPADAAPAPGTPEALVAWREVLGALERHPSDARQVELLDAYRTDFPGSPFASEAEALELLARSRTEPADRAVAELEAWLAAHPDGARALDVHAAAARLWREGLGDCARAEPHDAAVAAGARGARRETARALLGLCAMSRGDADRGRDLLSQVDASELDPALRASVTRALEVTP